MIMNTNNQRFKLDLNPKAGDENRVFLPHKEIFKSVKKNNRILIDDGKIILNIEKVNSDEIFTEVINGGKISNKKGLNIPQTLSEIIDDTSIGKYSKYTYLDAAYIVSCPKMTDVEFNTNVYGFFTK